MKKLMSVLDNLNLNTKQKENLINVLNDHIEEKINSFPKFVTLDMELSTRSDGKDITTINNIHPQTVVGNIFLGGVEFSFFDDFYKELKDSMVIVKLKAYGSIYHTIADVNLFYNDVADVRGMELNIRMDGSFYPFTIIN